MKIIYNYAVKLIGEVILKFIWNLLKCSIDGEIVPKSCRNIRIKVKYLKYNNSTFFFMTK